MTDKILRSDYFALDRAVNRIDDGEFRLLIHLIAYCDDHGRQVADPVIIRRVAMPRSERATPDKISRWLDGLAEAGILVTYTVDGEEYLQILDWIHQRKRSGDSRFPGHDDPNATVTRQLAPICANLRQLAPNCAKLAAAEKTPPHPRKRELKAPDNTGIFVGVTGETGETSPLTPYSPPPSPAFVLPLVDGTGYEVTEDMIREWSALYLAVDVEQEVRKMIGWLAANPKNRKTRSGIKRFCANWLAREQNRAASPRGQRGSPLDVIRAEREAST